MVCCVGPFGTAFPVVFFSSSPLSTPFPFVYPFPLCLPLCLPFVFPLSCPLSFVFAFVFAFVFSLWSPLPSHSLGTFPLPLTASLAAVQGLEGQEREEVEWGEVLHLVYSGLVATRRLLWDESERKIIALLSSSSAFEGDHFLQVRVPSCNHTWHLHAPQQQAAGASNAAVIQCCCDAYSGQSDQLLHGTPAACTLLLPHTHHDKVAVKITAA